MVWTLVDAVGAYALVETWRARSGASKSERDTLVAASYVSYLVIGVNELTGLLSPCKLPVQPIPFSPIVGVLDFVDIEHVTPAEHHVRRTWSVNARLGIGSLVAHLIPTRKGFACTILPCGARSCLTVIHFVGAAGDNAVAWST